MNRYYVFGHEDDDLFKKKKQEWKGRFYQNLQGKGKGWSFPVEMKETIERDRKEHDENHTTSSVVIILPTQSSSHQSEVVDEVVLSLASSEEENDDMRSVESNLSKPPPSVAEVLPPAILSKAVEKKGKRCYTWDLPTEVYAYFSTFVTS